MFERRVDKQGVMKIQWFEIEDVLKACDLDNVADGLSASLTRYLMWLHRRRSL